MKAAVYVRVATKKQVVHDLTANPIMEFSSGVVKGNPKRCLRCGKPIRKRETWTKHTSPADPVYGRYSVIVHTRCNGAKR